MSEDSEPTKRRRGRIPASAYPDILRRQAEGETLAMIAEDFGCTPSAVSYAIKKAQADGVPMADRAEEAPAPAAQEPPAREQTALHLASDRAPAPRTPASEEPNGPEPINEIEERLRGATGDCLSAYRQWLVAEDSDAEEALSESLHSLRKVLARIDIDLSAKRSTVAVLKPIPIPQHRAAHGKR